MFISSFAYLIQYDIGAKFRAVRVIIKSVPMFEMLLARAALKNRGFMTPFSGNNACDVTSKILWFLVLKQDRLMQLMSLDMAKLGN